MAARQSAEVTAALKLVAKGMTAYAAAKKTGIALSTIYIALARNRVNATTTTTKPHWRHYIRPSYVDGCEHMSTLTVIRPNKARTKAAAGVAFVSNFVIDRLPNNTGSRQIMADGWRNARHGVHSFLKTNDRTKRPRPKPGPNTHPTD